MQQFHLIVERKIIYFPCITEYHLTASPEATTYFKGVQQAEAVYKHKPTNFMKMVFNQNKIYIEDAIGLRMITEIEVCQDPGCWENW